MEKVVERHKLAVIRSISTRDIMCDSMILANTVVYVG